MEVSRSLWTYFLLNGNGEGVQRVMHTRYELHCNFKCVLLLQIVMDRLQQIQNFLRCLVIKTFCVWFL